MSYRKNKKKGNLKDNVTDKPYADSITIYSALRARIFKVYFVITPKIVHGKRGYTWRLTNTSGYKPGVSGTTVPHKTIKACFYDLLTTLIWDIVNEMPNFTARKEAYQKEVKGYALTITNNYERLKADSNK